MPHIRLKLSGRRELLRFGPRLAMDIGPPILFGSPRSQARRVTGLIDTGASRTVIAPGIATATGLRQIDEAEVTWVGGKGKKPVYVASVRFPEGLSTVEILEVIGSDLPEQPIDCLIGRDLLERWVLTYDGRSAEVTLDEEEFPPTAVTPPNFG